MALKSAPQFIFGGVDSRSNPLNMPTTRFLRVRNLVPMEDGHFKLRYGYSKVTMSAVSAVAIHSLTGYSVLGGSTYGVFFQATTPKKIDVATGTVSNPTVKGTALASANPFSYTQANGRLLAFNGTDKKYFDGVYWRDVGMTAPVAADVAGTTVVIGSPNANAIPATSIGGAQPGYIVWIAWWNRTTGAVSNCIQIGTRLAPSVASEFNIAGLPTPPDAEWDTLVGRTKDGALIPYAILDGSANWVYVPHGNATAVLNTSGIDGNSQLPTRNGVPPAFARVCSAGNRAYGNTPNSPFVYRSESPDDSTQGSFVGSWEQCWAANNVETFPTGKDVTCLREYALEPWVFSLHHMAILDESNAEPGWQGPWPIGCAGQEAFCSTPYGPFWVTGDKQLATMGPSGPIIISGEYEATLLSKIGSQYLSTVETRYHKDAAKRIDHVLIKARKSDGTTFRIIHDFKLRDDRSNIGQGYEDIFTGSLANAYTCNEVFDQYGLRHIWAGDSVGQLYELYLGLKDDASQYTGEAIALINAGPDRPDIPNIEWFGDSTVQWAIAQSLNQTEAQFKDLTPTVEAVPGGENDNQYKFTFFSSSDATITSEQKFLYLRMRITSHAGLTDSLDISDPPHMPLETYGRIYMISPLFGSERGHTP